MIKLVELEWSNAFSYGPNNKINFCDNSLTQLIGKNGHGKTSIALILEEILYNSNSKKVKKADILNRYSPAKSYSAKLTFFKDSDCYTISSIRGITQSVKLTKNSDDISAHTSTATYALIEEIIGLDFKTFSQVVHQSSASSLEFLTATDTNRKKFLIDLLNLSIYSKYGELFKSITKDVSDSLTAINTRLDTSTKMLSKLSNESLIIEELKEIPPPLTEVSEIIKDLSNKILTIDSTNKQITQNNKYKEILSNIFLDMDAKPPVDTIDIQVEIRNYKEKQIHHTKVIKDYGNLADKCHSCGQPIDNSIKKVLVEEAKIQLEDIKTHLVNLNNELIELNKRNTRSIKARTNQEEFEKYTSLINHSLQSDLLDEKELLEELRILRDKVSLRNSEITRLTKLNSDITAKNTRVGIITQQMQVLNEDIQKYSGELAVVSKRLNNLQVLVKTFSTSGLVAYKIECLVKDLENLTNEYLADMSDGRFQIQFKINSSDKLIVIITDNARDIDILALSAGERARVNVATLLAIRKLMQSLSNTRINLLILDETIESLDTDGKEKLIEVLLKEEHLNTILVSHGFTSPLLHKIHVIKENNISRLE